MTNINPQSELALARAVFPIYEWDNRDGYVRCGTGPYGRTFSPEKSDFPAVLCWLLANGGSVDNKCVEAWVNGTYFGMEYHDNTPASLAAAVHRAAIRCIEARTDR